MTDRVMVGRVRLMEWWLAVFLKPFFAVLLWIGVVYPLVRLFHRYMPEGRLKRLLTRPIGKQPGAR